MPKSNNTNKEWYRTNVIVFLIKMFTIKKFYLSLSSHFKKLKKGIKEVGSDQAYWDLVWCNSFFSLYPYLSCLFKSRISPHVLPFHFKSIIGIIIVALHKNFKFGKQNIPILISHEPVIFLLFTDVFFINNDPIFMNS